jgi:Na+(H+)/acetate symporter ActP
VDRLPAWFQLSAAGRHRLASKGRAPLVGFTSVGFERDAVLFALPVAAGMPQVIVYLALAGALAAAMAALAASMMAGRAILSEDVVHGLPNESGALTAPASVRAALRCSVSPSSRYGSPCRGSADPLQLFLWALTFSASASFPHQPATHIWWKRAQRLGRTRRHGQPAPALTMFMMLLSETGCHKTPAQRAGPPPVGLPLAFRPATQSASALMDAMCVPASTCFDMLQRRAGAGRRRR